ncbi:ankyrin repeat domain-containing protein [Flavobacteriaceae bacterium LMO-SS05]
MRKIVIIIAVALGLTAPTLFATNRTFTSIATFESSTPSEVSPFCLAIVKGDIETVEKLIELGSDVNETSIGLTPAMYAAKYNKVEILKLLVKKGADLRKRSHKGFTAKRYAQLSNAKDALEYLEKLES